MSHAAATDGSAAALVTVRVPSQLRTLTGGAGEVLVRAGTVRTLIAELDETHPGFGERILDEHGSLRRFVNVFVADEDVRFLDGLATVVEGGQTVSVVPAVAGG